jgi:hypothetical protein
MDKNQQKAIIESFISATLDSDRLKLISYLSQEPCSILDLAEKMDEEPAKLMRHLDVLEGANLVTVSESAGIEYYRFNSKSIESIARQQFEEPRQDKSFTNLPDDQMKLVSSYIQSDGSLKMIPSQKKKIKIILDYVIPDFEFDKDYSEKEVNEILAKYNSDTAVLRRYLIDYGYLDRERDGSRYWRQKEHPPISRTA